MTKNIIFVSLFILASSYLAAGEPTELLGVRFGDNFSKLEKSLISKYGEAVQSQSPQENIQQVAFNYQNRKVFLTISYRISDGRILCLGADGGNEIKSSTGGPLPGHLNLGQRESEIKKRLGNPSEVKKTDEGYTHYDYKAQDLSFEVKDGKIYSFEMCRNEQEPEPRGYKYTAFKDGKLVGEEKTSAPKYQQTISTPKVLYVKSLGMIIESDGTDPKSPLEKTVEGCKEKKEASGIMCRMVGFYYLDTKNLTEALSYLGKACDLHDAMACDAKDKLNQAGK